MSISLDKRAAKVGIVLAKRGLTKVPPTRVGAAFDVSGSAQGFYSGRPSTMQETIDRLLAVAMKFDDNGEIDSWLFHHGVIPMPAITAQDEGTYVQDKILRASGLWGSTKYAPCLSAVMEHYFPTGLGAVAKKASGFFGGMFGKKEAPAAAAPVSSGKEPAMLLFITDGANDDEAETTRVLTAAAQNSPLYINAIGLGSPRSFKYLERIADELPNVGFTNLNDLSISDDDLYEAIVNVEFCDWIKKL